MGDAGKPGAAAGLHIHHGAHRGACSRQTAQQRCRRIADSLADQFAIGVVMRARDTVGHN